MNREYGFSTKQAAIDAETARRKADEEKADRAAAGSPVVAALPKTLESLLQEWFAQHVDVKRQPKTRQRYHEQAAMLDPALLKMALPDVRPMHLNREWNRLLASGGHHRHTKAARPLSRKTVRNVAGVLSSAFKYALASDLVDKNPVLGSSPPVPRKPKGVGMTTSQVDMLIAAASGPWCMAMFLEMSVALGARRGEVLALRWSDIRNGRATLSRSLSQTKTKDLVFKGLKGHEEDEQDGRAPIPAETTGQARRAPQAPGTNSASSSSRPTAPTSISCSAIPTATPLRPDSISATVSALFKRLKITQAERRRAPPVAPPPGVADAGCRCSAAGSLRASGPLVDPDHSRDIRATRSTAQDDDATKKWEEYQDWRGRRIRR